MRRFLLPIALAVALSMTEAIAQQVTFPFTESGDAGCSGCYGGIWAEGTSVTVSCTFRDPLPVPYLAKSFSAQRTIARALPYSWAGVPVIVAYLNGVQLGTPQVIGSYGYCYNGTLVTVYNFQSAYHDGGIPGYVYGGTNTVTWVVHNGTIEWGQVFGTLNGIADPRRVELWQEGAPFISGTRGLQANCPAYDVDIGAKLTESGSPLPGVSLNLVSSRNFPGSSPDVILAPPATDAAGVTRARMYSWKQGAAAISERTIPTTPVDITFAEAPYTGSFYVTAYYTIEEADAHGPPVVNPCGVTGTFRGGFLREIRMEGSGVALDGRTIQYDTAASTRHVDCYMTSPCPLTASGACAVAGSTVAVDRTLIPLRSTIRMSQSGLRQADDTGEAITRYRIDLYVGHGRTAYRTWLRSIGNHDETVSYVSGGGTCN